MENRRGRLWTAALLLLIFSFGAGACGGCGEDEPSAPAKKESEQTKKADEDAQKGESMAQMREVFGLPMPPSVLRVERRDGKVSVKTDMSLEEIQSFFEARLTDFEILDAGFEVRAVGLRDYMPEVYAYGMGPSSYVVYIPPRNKPDKEALADSSDESSEAKAKAPKPEPRKYGEKVMDRTSDGRLLAPGARWGEPYTPPPGSPLHQERYRSNFGRPYGDWVLQ